jgi:hypothetical protein
MLKCTQTLITFSHQLHSQLEGEEIPIGKILKMDTPPNMFFNGIHSSREATRIG